VRRAARFFSLLSPLLAVLAFSKVHASYVADPPYDYTGSFRFAWSLAFAGLLALAAYGVGLPEVPRDLRSAVSASVVASIGAGLGISAVQLIVGDALLPRLVVLGTAVALVPVQVALCAVARTGRSRDEGRDRVVLVGSAEERDRLVGDLALSPERPAELVGHVEPGTAARGAGGPAGPVVDAVRGARATLVVLDRTAQLDDDVITQAAGLHEGGVRVRTLVQFYEEWLGKLPVPELERASLFFDIGEVHGTRYGRVKRLVDIACAVAGLPVLVLALPFVVLGNLFGNRGPVLYRQPRVGRDGVDFEIWKLRTMRVAAPGDAAATTWTGVDDPRITPFGGLLRATHVDELPQLVNILRGDLSVVGPRPEQPRYVTDLSEKLPFYGMRHLVRPGLTGWAQVKYGYAGDERDALEKLQYEFFYLRNQTLAFDLRIIGRTVRSVAGGVGRGR
jgi:lipopolysaccharide/colanic/teichoic acid biosynthesis glycosyltransferase